MSKKLKKKETTEARQEFNAENFENVAQDVQTENSVKNQSVVVIKEKKPRKPLTKK